MTNVTMCDMVRDAMAAQPQCGCPDPNKPQCKGITNPPIACSVFNLASHRDVEFQWQYDPTSLFSDTQRKLREKKLADIEGDIQKDEELLQTQYGAAAPVDQISWWRMQRCLMSPNGQPGGNFKHKYVGRQDMETAGYTPYPLFGGSMFEGDIPAQISNALPVYVDRIINSDLMIIIIFVLLVAIFAILIYKAYEWDQGEPAREAAVKAAQLVKDESKDPYRGTSFKSWPTDPNEKWKTLIPVYEAQGYCMKDYRKKLNMQPGPEC
jgi:hypothetical protein